MRRHLGKFLPLILFMSLMSCGLPRPGPTGFALSRPDAATGVRIIEVTQDVISAMPEAKSISGFPETYFHSPPLAYHLIRPDDILSITVWENVDDGLFSAGNGAKSSVMPNMQVDGAGSIAIPYVGRIEVSGKTVDDVRNIIVSRLSEQTPDPQVTVARAIGTGATISVSGNAGGQGIFPLDATTSTLAKAIVKAGGIAEQSNVIRITVLRGKLSGAVWLSELNSGKIPDINLLPNDRIYLEKDDRLFTALGAFAQQTRMEFPTAYLSLSDAIASVGGLNTQTGHPRGIFVLRENVLPDADLEHANPEIGKKTLYHFDMSNSLGLSLAQDFQIVNGDILYASEAPFVNAQKILSTITGSLGSVRTLAQQ